MGLKICGHGVVTLNDLETTRRADIARPSFRKATLNMMLTTLAAEQALTVVQSELASGDPSRQMALLGSIYGEIKATKDFLHSLYIDDLARPFIFQNSLHNATLGFLTTQLKWHGPGLTMSNDVGTAQDLISTARMQISSGLMDFCLVVMTDCYFDELRAAPYRMGKEGAEAVLLTGRDLPISVGRDIGFDLKSSSFAPYFGDFL
jgi:3-oxoacyl-(acyl-carrier-protein) synthase